MRNKKEIPEIKRGKKKRHFFRNANVAKRIGAVTISPFIVTSRSHCCYNHIQRWKPQIFWRGPILGMQPWQKFSTDFFPKDLVLI